ncbi:immunoglobulin-like domain-containing protein [Colwellia piezophila]|uniref:immunoglobulin-like domain-containing protein n=1 Tax=Colwellia piezophila TaxID=211668 RepID=UPI000364EA64|nr:immunoglobulin-like domain-containing protein [Colwellia piezophila]
MNNNIIKSAVLLALLGCSTVANADEFNNMNGVTDDKNHADVSLTVVNGELLLNNTSDPAAKTNWKFSVAFDGNQTGFNTDHKIFYRYKPENNEQSSRDHQMRAQWYVNGTDAGGADITRGGTQDWFPFQTNGDWQNKQGDGHVYKSADYNEVTLTLDSGTLPGDVYTSIQFAEKGIWMHGQIYFDYMRFGGNTQVYAPADIELPATTAGGLPFDDASLTAFYAEAFGYTGHTDETVTHNGATITGGTFPVGDTTVTFTAGSVTATATVTVTGAAGDTTIPTISLLGDAAITLTFGDLYNDAGATANDNVDGEITGNIILTGSVNTSVAGTYTLTYNVKDAANNAAVTVTREVTVNALIDVDAPVISLIGLDPFSIQKGQTYTDPGYSAIDTVDGDVAVSVTGTVDTNVAASYVLTYTATDTAGNEAQVTRTIIVTAGDEVAPIIMLAGDNPLFLEEGSNYTEPGYSANDAIDGAVVVSVTGTVDTNVIASYVLTYTATDTAGNEAQATRTVIISLKDTDGDGVPDVDDAFPQDPLETVDTDGDGIGDNADPDIDGDGVLNENDADPYTAVSQADDLDRDGIADDIDSDGVDILDAISVIETALLAQIDSAISIDASAIETDIGPSVVSFVNDALSAANVNGVTVDSIVGDTSKRSGAHTVTVQLINTVGSEVSFDALIHITPSVSIPEKVFVLANEEIVFNLDLSGAPVSYPVTLTYLLETVEAQPVNIKEGLLTLEQGETINLVLPAQSRGDYRIVFTEGTDRNAAILANATTVIYAEENTPPAIDVALLKAGQEVTLIDQTTSDAAIAINITDVDMNTEHTVVVNLDGVEILNTHNDMNNPAEVINIDAAILGAGEHELVVVVTELFTEEEYSVTQTSAFTIAEALPVLADTNDDGSIADSDGDGISDADEGFGDVDGDGIADYLDDANLMSNEQKIGSGDNALIVSVDDGLSISIGNTLKSLESGMSDDIAIEVTRENFISVLEISDLSDEKQIQLEQSLAEVKSFLMPLIDFKITGVRAGATANMILPLPMALTAKTEYRKLKKDGSLIAFDINNGNAIMSAMKDAQGECPAATSDVWQTGLVQGNDCVKLAIVDGGANDDDGETNGVIVDPAVIVDVNSAPNVSLNELKSVNENTQVNLNARAVDIDGDVQTYIWTQTAGQTVVMSGVDSDTLTFTAPEVAADETLTFTLSVSDGVNATVKTINVKVVAIAILDATFASSEGTVSLTASVTGLDDFTRYSWTQISGEIVILSGAEEAVASFTAVNVAGTLMFKVTTSNENGTKVLTKTVEVDLTETGVAGEEAETDSKSGGSFGINMMLLLAGFIGLRRKVKAK